MGRVARALLPQVGIDPRRLKRSALGLPQFVRDLRRFRAMSATSGLAAPRFSELYPALSDRVDPAGVIDAHYFHQDLWAARLIAERRPREHFDVGSRLDGFLAHLLVFMPVTMLDVRPMPNPPAGLAFQQADATALPFPDRSVDSLSSLHAVEHFGLGRYGDPLDPLGTDRGIRELARVVCGRLYLGLPVGRDRVEFNAQRVLSPRRVLDLLSPLRLVSFAAVTDAGRFVTDADPSDLEGSKCACGLFEMAP